MKCLDQIPFVSRTALYTIVDRWRHLKFSKFGYGTDSVSLQSTIVDRAVQETEIQSRSDYPDSSILRVQTHHPFPTPEVTPEVTIVLGKNTFFPKKIYPRHLTNTNNLQLNPSTAALYGNGIGCFDQKQE